MRFPKPRSRFGVPVLGGESWEMPGKRRYGLCSGGFNGITEQGTARDGEDGNSLPGSCPGSGGIGQGRGQGRNPRVWDVQGYGQGVFLGLLGSNHPSGMFPSGNQGAPSSPEIPGSVWGGELLRQEKMAPVGSFQDFIQDGSSGHIPSPAKGPGTIKSWNEPWNGNSSHSPPKEASGMLQPHTADPPSRGETEAQSSIPGPALIPGNAPKGSFPCRGWAGAADPNPSPGPRPGSKGAADNGALNSSSSRGAQAGQETPSQT